MRPRVLLAGLFHETHTFLEEVTRREAFTILRGQELLENSPAGSPLRSAIDRGQHHGWQIIPTVDYRAQPSGTVEHEVFEHFWLEFRLVAEAAFREGIDAVYLVLHGAMATTHCVDVEGEFLERLRSLPGGRDVPVFGVYDLHANFSQRMAAGADCLVAYRENPHTDACAMAAQGVDLLQNSLLTKQRPRTYFQSAKIVWAPSGTGTADVPLRDLEALAREFESLPGIMAVNVCGGFAFADTPDTGASFSVVTTGPEQEAREILAQLCERAWELREAGLALDPPVAEVMGRLRARSGLIVIAEPADNIGGGAPGDGTGLLRALIKYGVQRSLVCLCDVPAVRRSQDAGVGTHVPLALGGRGSSLAEGPLELEVEVISLRDGRFHLEDPQSHLASMFGNEFDMGPCAVVRHAGITILLTSHKTPPFDLGQWRSQGIEPTDFSVIGVKAAVAHRQAYAPIASELWSIDTPGPCRSDLRMLPYQRLRRPIFPLDASNISPEA